MQKMNFTIHKATKEKAKLRLGLMGPAGSGKTYTALTVAQHLGNKVAVIDTEHGSASKYADIFNFDVLGQMKEFDPRILIQAINYVESNGYNVLIIDSLSHFWNGQGGLLEQVDKFTRGKNSSNAFTTGWREMSPVHNQLVDKIIGSKLHIIATMRVKTDYVMEKDEKGKTAPKKVGLAPVQRDGMEYEFDIICDLDWDQYLTVSKTRCPELKGIAIKEPGEDFAMTIKKWLESGVEPVVQPSADVIPLVTEKATSEQIAAFNGLESQLNENTYHTLWDWIIKKYGLKDKKDFETLSMAAMENILKVAKTGLEKQQEVALTEAVETTKEGE